MMTETHGCRHGCRHYHASQHDEPASQAVGEAAHNELPDTVRNTENQYQVRALIGRIKMIALKNGKNDAQIFAAEIERDISRPGGEQKPDSICPHIISISISKTFWIRIGRPGTAKLRTLLGSQRLASLRFQHERRFPSAYGL